jgi:hypothetical protein
MATYSSSALGGGGRQTATATPGRNVYVRKDGSRGRTGVGKGFGKPASASEIMKGKAPKDNAPAKMYDGYPGLDAILQSSRKMKPFLPTETLQLERALTHMLPLSTFPAKRLEFVRRMEKDYVAAVAKWRSDNWLLPVEKESEFPYTRTPNLVDPRVKYGNLWLREDYECGFTYDSEGESIGFSKFMDNCRRAAAVESIDLAIKGVEVTWAPEAAFVAKLKAENVELKKAYATTVFDRYEEVLKTYYSDGYSITGRYMAFKLFSKEQQRLLNAYESLPGADTKKVLLQHIYAHGQLVRDAPKEDSHIKKVVAVVAPKKISPQVGSVMDSTEV